MKRISLLQRRGIRAVMLLVLLVLPYLHSVAARGQAAAASDEPAQAPVSRELLNRLKSEYRKAGDDLDRKEKLIAWAVKNGRPAVVALNSLAVSEGKMRLASYGEAFFKQISAAKKKDVESVLASKEELQKQRNRLVRFSQMAGRLKGFLDADKPRKDEKAEPEDFAKYLRSQEEAAIERWLSQHALAGLTAEEVVVVEMTNRTRRQQGLRPLAVDPALCAAARDHSKDMVTRGFFSHESPVDGKTSFTDRAARLGTTAGAENIAKAGGGGEKAFKWWMGSDVHRRNILTEDFRRIGVGYHEGHFTQMFGR